jgi:glycerol kinase
VRATLESIAFSTKDILSAMEKDSGKRLKYLNVDGGASSNNFLMQFQSDLLKIPIIRPENIESTAKGAAMLAGLSSGVLSIKTGTEIKKSAKVFEPDKKSGYDKLYTEWVDLHNKLI